MSSTRLPGKVAAQIMGKPMLAHQVERLQRSRMVDQVVIATSVDQADERIVEIAHSAEVPCYRGALDDVLDRLYRAVSPYRPDYVVRTTGDCPLIDWEVVDGVIRLGLHGRFDYVSSALRPTFPDGLDVEFMKFEALETAWREASDPLQREHVTLFIHRQPDRFRLGSYEGKEDLSHLRWTVDEPRDLRFVEKVYESLYEDNPEFRTPHILKLMHEQPNLAELNHDIMRNEGLLKAERELTKDDE
jgi:spore coat polysaccharide biosynthesis protein SpsF